MLDNLLISLIIPALNEAQGIAYTLQHAPRLIDEVIVVDNGSSDNTPQIARINGALVVTQPLKGYGWALQKGLATASGDIMVICDGDGTYPLEGLDAHLSYMIDKNIDFLSGCRLNGPIFRTMPLSHVLANQIISALVHVLFRIPLKDSQSGFMILRKWTLPLIMPTNIGMGFSQELKIRAWRKTDIKSAETDISYAPRIGKSKFNKLTDAPANVKDLFLLRRAIH